MSYPSIQTLEHEVDQQTRLVRGLMAALYARIDSDPDESLLRELAEAKQTLRELQQQGIGPGRPGWLPTQVPHRSGLAHHAHPVPLL